MSRTEEARRLAAVVATPLPQVPEPEPELESEPVLETLQRLFRQADLPTKRAFWSWVQEYAQLHADQGLREEW